MKEQAKLEIPFKTTEQYKIFNRATLKWTAFTAQLRNKTFKN